MNETKVYYKCASPTAYLYLNVILIGLLNTFLASKICYVVDEKKDWLKGSYTVKALRKKIANLGSFGDFLKHIAFVYPFSFTARGKTKFQSEKKNSRSTFSPVKVDPKKSFTPFKQRLEKRFDLPPHLHTWITFPYQKFCAYCGHQDNHGLKTGRIEGFKVKGGCAHCKLHLCRIIRPPFKSSCYHLFHKNQELPSKKHVAEQMRAHATPEERRQSTFNIVSQ